MSVRQERKAVQRSLREDSFKKRLNFDHFYNQEDELEQSH